MPDRSTSVVKTVVLLLLAFALLGAADLLLTWRLIHRGDGRVFESNPVAGWWLANHGWGGMVAFKGGAILLLGVLACLLAWKRPRTGEFVLVFGCGAQSAVVFYSVLLMCFVEDSPPEPGNEILWGSGPGDGSRRGLPWAMSDPIPENGLLLLLASKPVQDELKLPQEKAKRLAELAAARLELRQHYRKLNEQERTDRAADLLAQERNFLDGLAPEQSARLQEIAWQQRGPLAFGDADVAATLDLTAEQKESVRALLEEARTVRAGAQFSRMRWPGGGDWRKTEEELSRIKDRLLAVLTPEQKEIWKEMTGEPFKADLRNRPQGPPSFGGRDFRRPRR
jgi:hypothetical protein